MNKSPKILVISNNSFSDTSNNGKTLASFFKGFPSENIAQLYFNAEIPTDKDYANYFRITDSDIINSFKSSKNAGRIIEMNNSKSLKPKKNNYRNYIIKKLKKYNIFRIFRDLIWESNKWKTESLNEWVSGFSPDIIFLCAGDTGFVYDISEYIRKEFKTKLIVYITDDYILPRKTISPFWWLRRNYIYRKMNNIIKRSDLFITISEEMRKTYKELFKVDSILAMNMTESIKEKDEKKLGKNEEKIIFVYAGGLHLKRYKTLKLLSKAISKYNLKSRNKKAFLKIYSGCEPNKNIKKLLNVKDVSEYGGSLNQEELKVVLNKCDIPVHVESFDSKSLESTRLSISTKIPEYLSLGKPILAIGPEEVASMKYLADSAFCITNPYSIYTDLNKLLNNRKLYKQLSEKSLIKFENFHKKEVILKSFMDNIMSVIKK